MSRLSWVVVACLGGTLACAGGPDGTGECQKDRDCGSGKACVNEVCRSLCQTARDCAPAETCGAGGVCTVATNGECSRLTDCTASGARCADSPSAQCVGGACLCGGCDDSSDCGEGYDCFVDTCLLEIGQLCAEDAECGSEQCECADATCSTRRCNAVACACGYVSGGACAGNLAPGTQDPDDCVGDNACFYGNCLKDVGTACSADANCGSGHCECVDNTCVNRVCAESDCVCRWGANGACTANVMDGQNDPLDCPTSCQSGICVANLGDPCLSDQACSTGTCECVTSRCEEAVCAAADCICRYGSSGGCISPLANGSKDIVDCDGAFACYSGTCLLAQGSECFGDAECGTGHCECIDESCSTRQCVGADCPCKYGLTCNSTFPDGSSDPEDCEGAGQGCYAGACLLTDGQTCETDDECGSDHCFESTCQEVLCDAAAIAATPYSGTGSTLDPFVICTAAQLDAIQANTADHDKVFWLGAHIDLSAYDGQGANPALKRISSFSGTFDGRGRILAGLRFVSNNDGGLFGTLEPTGVVENLEVSGATVTGQYSYTDTFAILVGQNRGTIRFVQVSGTVTCDANCGGIAASNDGTIEDCDADVNLTVSNSNSGIIAGASSGTIARSHALGSLTSNANTSGGLVGHNSGTIQDCTAGVVVTGQGQPVGGLVGNNTGTIERSTASGTVSNSSTQTGGLVGYNSGGTVRLSSATGSVTVSTLGSGHYTGGLVGYNTGLLDRCFAGGNITEPDSGAYVGGLVGYHDSSGTIQDCYATGSVSATSSGSQRAGGLVGEAQGDITRSYASGNVSGVADWAGGLVGMSYGDIASSFAIGSVRGSGNTNGLIGYRNAGQVLSCYWYDADITDDATACWNQAPDANCAQETTLSNFYASSHAVYTGWDFTTVWQENTGALPTLRAP